MTTNGTEARPLPTGWTWTNLESVIENHDSRRIPVRKSDRAETQGQYPYYGASGIIDYVDDFLFEGNYLLLAEDGANLLSRSTPIAFQARGKFWVNNHAHVMKTKDGIPLSYLEHYLNSINLANFITGTAQPKLTQRNMNKIPVPVAPIPEQKHIVAEIEKQFARLDQAVASLRRLQSNLARYKASVLKAACDGRLVPQNPNDGPATTLLTRILAERRAQWQAANPGKKYKEVAGVETADLPDLPEGWVWASIDSILREPLRNGHSAKATTDPNGIRTLTLTAVTQGDFSEENTKLTGADPERVKDMWLEPGDILIERSNTPELVGTTRLYKGSKGFAIFPDLIIRARVSNLLSEQYVEIAVRSRNSHTYFKRSAQGISGTMPKISQSTVRNLRIPIPPLAEQERIVAEVERRLSVVTATEQAITANLARAERLRQAILHRAFTGQLVPQQEGVV